MIVSGLAARPMSQDEYRHYAVECLLLAREMRDAAQKPTLLAMADAWTALADQERAGRRRTQNGARGRRADVRRVVC